jgi:hypothetical protein
MRLGVDCAILYTPVALRSKSLFEKTISSIVAVGSACWLRANTSKRTTVLVTSLEANAACYRAAEPYVSTSRGNEARVLAKDNARPPLATRVVS